MFSPLRITLIYLVIGVFWILVSDSILLLIVNEHQQSQFSFFQTAKGLFYVFSTAVILYFLIRQYYIALNQKMVQLENLNEELKVQSEKLKASNEELEQFAFIASHDLQEPLRNITSFLSHLENKYSDVLDDKGKTYIGFAVNGAKQMRQIILDLLELSRVSKPQTETQAVDLNEVLEEVVAIHRELIANTGARVSWATLPSIRAHPNLMIQVFSNLIGNALQYSRPGVPPKITANATDHGRKWLFSVNDNGIGIEEDYYEKIFVIFQRLQGKERHRGSGIGLTTVKKIVEILGGEVWVKSKPGEGSTFFFTIPKH